MRNTVFLGIWLVSLVITLFQPVAASAAGIEATKDVDITPMIAETMRNTITARLAHETGQSLSAKTSYQVKAEAGDGVTHLARKAIHQYLHDQERSDDFDRSEKVYLEDYIQNRIGTFGLALNEVRTITLSEIQSAIDAVSGVDKGLLAGSLARFVQNVNWDKYETLDFVGYIAADNQGFSTTPDTNTSTDKDKNTQDDSATSDDSTNVTNNGATDVTATSTENDNAARNRTITYLIVVIVILVAAGYLLFKGTREEDETPRMDELKEKEQKTESDKKEDYTKTDNK